MDVDIILSRIDKVRSNGANQWMACCPSHDDKSPSLSIKETSDKKILLHCFSGCSPAEILSAVGLRLADLFDDNKIPRNKQIGPSREAVEWSQIVTMLVDYNRRQGYGHSPEDEQVIAKATDILNRIPTPQKPTGKRKLAPFSKPLAERQRYNNLPFFVVACIGVDAWERAKLWSESPNDIVGLVLPDCWPEAYLWPVTDCRVIIERDLSPGDELTVSLARCLLIAGAQCVVIRTLGYGVEHIYFPPRKGVVNAAA